MADQQSRIVITGVDRISGVLLGAAINVEAFNKKLSQGGAIGQAWGLLAEQLAPRWAKVSAAFGRMQHGLRWMAGSAVAIGGAAAALGKLGLSAADAADKVGDLAERYQVASETLQVATAMVEESGGSMEDAAAAIGKLKKAMNEAIHGGKEQAAAFAGVGISVDQLRKMRPEQVLERMADAFKGSDKDLAKQAVLLELMGKNGTVMMAALNQGGQAWRDKLAEMQADGRIFGRDQLDAADRFDKAWRRATGALEGLRNMIGLDLAEALLPVVESFRGWAVANREVIRSGFADFLKHLPQIIDNVVVVGKDLWAVFTEVAQVIRFLGHAFGTATVVWGAFAAAVGPAMIGLLQTFWQIGRVAAAVFGGPVVWAVTLAATAAWLLYRNWDEVVAGVSQMWDDLAGGIRETWEDLSSWWSGLWDGIESAAVERLRAISGWLSGLLPDWMQGPGGRAGPSGAADRIAAASRAEVSGRLAIDVTGPARVRNVEASGGMDLDVSTGLSMVGAS